MFLLHKHGRTLTSLSLRGCAHLSAEQLRKVFREPNCLTCLCLCGVDALSKELLLDVLRDNAQLTTLWINQWANDNSDLKKATEVKCGAETAVQSDPVLLDAQLLFRYLDDALAGHMHLSKINGESRWEESSGEGEKQESVLDFPTSCLNAFVTFFNEYIW